jgi:signal transduction histidine kinase
MFIPHDRDRVLADIQKILNGEGLSGIEYTAVRKDGSTFPVIAYSAPITQKDKIVGIRGILVDATEIKTMEEQLLISDRMATLGELISGIAHEINNPLTSIVGFAQLLLDKDLPDDVKEDLSVINNEAERTTKIVRNLLMFARKREPKKAFANLNEIIEAVLALRTYEQKVQNIQVDAHLDQDLPKILTDSFQLQQVFLNIIINAEYFMSEAYGKGTLTITTERVNDLIRASFADDGPGIAKEDMGRLFDSFFTTKEVGKGTGLGLSIAQSIITEHGGRIYAESELGKGTTFIVELPISKQKGGTEK